MTAEKKRAWWRRILRFTLPLLAAESVSQLASSFGANLITESPLINSLLAVLFGVALSLLLEMRVRTMLSEDDEPKPDPAPRARTPDSGTDELYGDAQQARQQAALLPVPDATAWFRDNEPRLRSEITELAASGRHPTVRELRAVAAVATALCRWYVQAGRYPRPGTDSPARRVADAVEALSAPHHRRVAWPYNELGALARAGGDGKAALYWLDRAWQQRAGAIPRGRAQVATNLGLAELAHDRDEALYLCWRGAQLRRDGDRLGQGYANLALAVAYLRHDGDEQYHQHVLEAERCLVTARYAFETAKDDRGVACAAHDLGLLYFAHNAESARTRFHEAHELLVRRDESGQVDSVDPDLAIRRVLSEADLLCAEPRTDPQDTLRRLADARALAVRLGRPDHVDEIDRYATRLRTQPTDTGTGRPRRETLRVVGRRIRRRTRWLTDWW